MTCAWSARVEQGCRSYRLHRVCPDGTSTLVADSVSCLGAGVPHVFMDDPAPCTGEIKYVLSLVDSLAPGLWEENVIAEAALVIGGTRALAPVSGARRTLAAPGSDNSGCSTPEEAIQALGYAVTEHDPTRARHSVADLRAPNRKRARRHAGWYDWPTDKEVRRWPSRSWMMRCGS